MPYHTIDVIFNHKNIWANLQNANPQVIKYDIHDNTQWLPLITAYSTKHPKEVERDNAGKNTKGNKTADTDGKKKKGKGEKGKGKDGKDAKIFEMKLAGDYMKPFTSFYDAKAMEPPLKDREVLKLESKIYKEVEIAIRQVRSSRNLTANMNNNFMTRTILGQYLDYLEDAACHRILKKGNALTAVNKEIMKLVPENYKISMLPAFFNHIDGERIGTVIRDTSSQFLLDTQKKVKFSVAVKIYAYNSSVNSVRVVLVKFQNFEGAHQDDGGTEGGSKKSKKSKS